MARFPITLGRQTFHTLAELVADLRHRGSGGVVDNPAQYYPVDHYHAMWWNKPDARQAVHEAATELLAESEDPGVLLLCAHLGPGPHTPYLHTLLQRLETGHPPIPDAPGQPGPSLLDDLLHHLTHPTLTNDPALARRAKALLHRHQRTP